MNESSWEHDGSFVSSAFQPRPSIYFIVCLAPDIRLMARLKACDRSPAACRMKRSNGQWKLDDDCASLKRMAIFFGV